MALVEGMFRGKGKDCPAPNLIDMGWKEGQKFSAEADPDRTLQPFEPPPFLARAAGGRNAEDGNGEDEGISADAPELVITPIQLPWRNGEEYFACSVDNVLSASQCQQVISMANTKGFTPALLNVGYGRQMMSPGVRDGWRCIVDFPEFADFLLRRLRTVLPAVWHHEYHLRDINERLRILFYTPGQEFEAHCDGCYPRPRGHPRQGDRSMITIQLYLNDVPAECGGATTFLGPRGEKLPYCPRVGSVLLFSQNLLHEGSKLLKGGKYTLRTEAMYSPGGSS